MDQKQTDKYFQICNDDLCHQTLGLRATEISEKCGICELELKKWHMNFEGCAHGGILFSLMDTCMGFCVYPHLTPSEMILAIDVKINYLKPAVMEMKKIICESQLVSRTRRLAVSEGEILSPKGDILCKALGTFAILKKK